MSDIGTTFKRTLAIPNFFTNDLLKYFILGTAFWVVVDFTTAFNPDLQGWFGHMP
jgi:hypothetical protein